MAGAISSKHHGVLREVSIFKTGDIFVLPMCNGTNIEYPMTLSIWYLSVIQTRARILSHFIPEKVVSAVSYLHSSGIAQAHADIRRVRTFFVE